MVPSSAPPPLPDASTSVTTTRPQFQNPNLPIPQNPNPFHSPPPSRLPSNPNPNYPQLAPRAAHPNPHFQDPSQMIYPVGSSCRGFLSRPAALPVGHSSQRPPFLFPYMDQGQGNPNFVRPNHFQHLFLGSGPGSAGNAPGAAVMPGVVEGIPVPSSHHTRVAPASAPISDNNGHKDLRDRNRDGDFIVVTNRKIRKTQSASLYSLCRSWLRNGFPEESPPQYLDTVRSLPRPLSVDAQLADSPHIKEGEKEEEDEDMGSVEHLSEKELLQTHIKRAKKVRSRLREERLQRITRYRTRLALLLPPMVEQHLKNESIAN